MYEIFYFEFDSRITYKLRDEDTISCFSRDIPSQIWIIYDWKVEVITLIVRLEFEFVTNNFYIQIQKGDTHTCPYIHACTHACARTHKNTHTQKHTHKKTHTQKHTHTKTHTHKNTHTQKHTLTHKKQTHTQTHTHTYIHTHIHTYTHTHTHTRISEVSVRDRSRL